MRIVAALAVAVAGAAVILAGCAALLPSVSPSASRPEGDMAWSRVAIPPDLVLAHDAYKACVEPRTIPVPLPLIVQDQRGPGAAFFVWGDATSVISCLAVRQSGLIHGVVGIDSPLTVGHTLAATLYTNGSPHVMIGDTGPGTHVVVQLADGTSFEASTGRGLFGAWWPQAAPAVALRSFDNAGALVETYEIKQNPVPS
jgi:hypothetical protein